MKNPKLIFISWLITLVPCIAIGWWLGKNVQPLALALIISAMQGLLWAHFGTRAVYSLLSSESDE